MVCLKKYFLLFLTFFLFLTQLSIAQTPLSVARDTTVSLLAEENSLQPGRPFWVAVHLDIPPDWHVYWKNPGEAGMPVQIEWNLPPHFSVRELEWPSPHKIELAGIIGFGYDDHLTLLAQIIPDDAVVLGQEIEIGAKASWLSCSDTECLPGNAKLAIQLPVTNTTPSLNPNIRDRFTKARKDIPEHPEAVFVTREQGALTLSVKLTPAAFSSGQLKFEFYPETKNHVDLRHGDGNLSSEGSVELSLKELNSSAILKGIFVARDGNTARAFHINAPIAGDSHEIAFANVDASRPSSASAAAEDVGGFWMALLFAFAGGVILNLMPCVLPVISFKVLSFIKMSRETRATTFKHGLSFSFGVVASFWVLAGLLLILRSYGSSVGWGFQLQEPLFVGILAGIMFLLSLSLMGVFELGTSVSSWAGQVEHSTKKEAPEGLFTSFCSGVLATALATPCTGPFLGTAVGLAVTLPAYQALLIFTSLGLGMASPYLLLGLFPSLLRFMPKPGAWMETFKQVMGFLVLGSVLWLIWVFAAQTSEISLFGLLIALYFLSIGSWIYGRWSTPSRSRYSRMFGTLTALVLLIGSGGIIHKASTSFPVGNSSKVEIASGWEPYSSARLAELQSKGVPVIVDFTAKWCLICQANHLVFSADDVNDKLNELGVVRMLADWTRNDPEITEALTQFGRNSVPLYLLYGPEKNSAPKILPQVLTPDIVMGELNQFPDSIADNEKI